MTGGWVQLRFGPDAGTWVRALTPGELDRREQVATALFDTDPNMAGAPPWPPPDQWRVPYLEAAWAAIRHLYDDEDGGDDRPGRARAGDAAVAAELRGWADVIAFKTGLLADRDVVSSAVEQLRARAAALDSAHGDGQSGGCPDCGYEGPHRPIPGKPGRVECGGGGCGASWDYGGAS